MTQGKRTIAGLALAVIGGGTIGVAGAIGAGAICGLIILFGNSAAEQQTRLKSRVPGKGGCSHDWPPYKTEG